jgi:ABC-type bacteriocin/lantibiotic exporter with double-glycine peptidase domain
MSGSLDFAGVAFSYDTLGSPLIADLSVRFPAGWTGIVGANGSGKTTLLRLDRAGVC